MSTDVETIRAQVEQRRAEEAATVPALPTVERDPGPGITSRFISECLANNERGDALMYAALHRDKFVYVKRSTSWLWWNGVHWEDDKRGLAWYGVEEVATTYLGEAAKVLELLSAERTAKADAENGGDAARVTVATSRIASYRAEHKALMRRVQRLRGKKGVLPTLEWSHHIGPDSICIIGDEIDQQPWLLPCRNGVVDLKDGKLRPGDPRDYIVTSIPIDFPACEKYLFDGSNSPCPTWEKFISEIHPDKNGAPDHETIAFIQRLFGYSITGLTTEHYIGTFVGDGRNGKGTMFETIRCALGGLAWAIQPELLLEQKNPRSSAGPSADLMSLYGKRFVIASETDAGRRISGSKVKSLTGSDTITARTPNDKFEINFRPSHTIFLYTNEPPWGLTADFALRQRLLFIEYPLRYVDDPDAEAQRDPSNAAKYRKKNPNLPAQLMAELPGIVAWLVRGCLLWQQEGINPPEAIRKAAERLSEDEDYLQQYLSACCTLDNPSAMIYFRDLFAEFDAWYQAEIDNRAGKCRSKRWLGLQLRKKGYLPGKDGDRTYRGITVTRNYVKVYP